MNIILHKNFGKKFIKLSSKIQESFRKRRDLFLENPLYPLLGNHPLAGDRKGQWSINVTGDWRAIYVFKNEDTIVFIDIDTHSNLYK
jgi:proteic killer suppression protein